jgi:hypothetical protein
MKHREVLRTRERLARRLASAAEIVRGSLLNRTIRHRQGCAGGEGHSVWVLTVSYPGGRTRQFSIRPEQRKQVEQWVRNYHQLRAKLEAICEFNHELLRAVA